MRGSLSGRLAAARLVTVVMVVAACAGVATGVGTPPSSTGSAAAPAPRPSVPTTTVAPTPTTTAAAEVLAETTARVELAMTAFSPAAITVPVGATVLWENQDTIPHTVTAAQGSFDAGQLAPGDGFSHVFTSPGTVEYFCSIHPSSMRGVVEVTG